MKSMEVIIHQDDWKSSGASVRQWRWTEEEIKVMLYNYGMEILREIERCCIYEDGYNKRREVMDDIEKEVANQVIV